MAESLIDREELHQHYLSRVTILLDDAYQNGWNAGYVRATRDMREASASQLRTAQPETPKATTAGSPPGQRIGQTTAGPFYHASEAHPQGTPYTCHRQDLPFEDRLTCSYVQMHQHTACWENHATT